MKKRLRKKKKLGEFDRKGFEIEIVFPRSLLSQEDDEFVDSFLEFAESMHLAVGGGGNCSRKEFFIAKYLPGKRKLNGRIYHKHVDCSVQDQSALKKWIEQKISGTNVSVSDLIGCNSGK